MLKRLRVKIVCFTMAIVTVMLCVIFGLTYYFTKRNLEEESLRMMQLASADPFRPGRPGERLDGLQLPHFTVQIDESGRVTAMGNGYYDLSDEDFVMELLRAASAAGTQTGVLNNYDLRFLAVGTPQGQLYVFADMSIERAALSSLTQTCLGIGVLSLIGFLVLSLYLARLAVRPVERAWEQQKQFVADASHELKTPLTVIMTNAELLQSAGQGQEAQARFSDNILAMSRQMRGLVEGLLELARVDNGAIKTAFRAVDYSTLISDAVLPFEPLYFERELGMTCRMEAGIRVKGSESHLRQVAEILLDNAMKYASPKAEVEILLKRQGRHCLFCVSNPGDPIGQEDLKHIFERFYRVDKVRSMNRSYGLGLSIAQGIVSEHHGRIWAESAGGINRFCVLLPMM